jgi:1,4-alpha-glucan branching enzyme
MKAKRSSKKIPAGQPSGPSDSTPADFTPAVPAPETRVVLFDVHIGEASEVYLVGTFNDWHPTTLPMIDRGHGRWEKEILLPPGCYEYLLVADGQWMPDPMADETVANPFGGVNCVRTVV